MALLRNTELSAASSSNEEELSACSEVEVLESRREGVEPGRDKAAEGFETEEAAGSRAAGCGEGFFLPPESSRSKPASPMDTVVAGLVHHCSVAAAFSEK